MELRVLQYFLAVAREQSISGAAEYLHLSQPTLSRQLRDLEDELGKQLFIRGSRRITLTEEGMILRKRAEEIMDLVKKAEDEIAVSEETISGDIHIGAGETDAIHLLARAAHRLRRQYPGIRFHIVSGDSENVTELLDRGLLDFGLLFDHTDLSRYNHLCIPVKDVWGVLMRRDSPLAQKPEICAEDLWDKPLLLSRQQKEGSPLALWLQKDFSSLDIASTYSLIYNASILVDEGMGYAVTLDRLINTSGESTLCFRPLTPRLEAGMSLVWKKYQVLPKAPEKFLKELRRELTRGTHK